MDSIHHNGIDVTKFSDSEVVEHVLAGEKELFELLLRRYNQLVFRVVRSYLNSEDDTRDTMQEAYVKAYIKLSQFKHEASFSTWLIRIAINEALQEIRKKKRLVNNYGEIENLDSVFQLSDTTAMNPEKQLIKSENKTLIEAAVDRLPEKYRVVFVLQQVEGLSNSEIAECLQITDSNVKVRLHRAKKLLKEEMFRKTHDASIFEFGNEKCDAMVKAVMERIKDL